MGNKASVIIDNTLPWSKGYATHWIIAATLPAGAGRSRVYFIEPGSNSTFRGSIRVFMDFAELETDDRNYTEKYSEGDLRERQLRSIRKIFPL